MPPDIVFAAGSLLWRHTPSGPQIALVRRGSDDPWTLPQARAESSADCRKAALRVLLEQIRCVGSIRSYAGLTYRSGRSDTLVLFWNVAQIGVVDFQPNQKAGAMKWVGVEDVRDHLRDPIELRIVLENSACIQGGRMSLNRLYRTQPERERLRSELESLASEIEWRRKESGEGTWYASATDLYQKAVRAFDAVELDKGWRLFKAAKRETIRAYSKHELEIESTMLSSEAPKLKAWRGEAVKSFVTQGKPLATPQRAAFVAQAAAVRDEHNDNMWDKLIRMRSQSITVGIIAVVFIFAFIVVFNIFGRSPTALSEDLRSSDLVLIALMGGLGACLTILWSFCRINVEGKLPDRVGHSAFTWTRLIFGAGAAIALYFFIRSGVLPLGGVTWAHIFVASFTAGFSERFLSGAVEKAEGKAETQ